MEVMEKKEMDFEKSAIEKMLNSPFQIDTLELEQELIQETAESDEDFKQKFRELILAKHQEDLDNRKGERAAREKYGRHVCLFVFSMIIAAFIAIPIYHCVGVSDRIMMTFLASTTATIIGLLHAVVKYFFPKRDCNCVSQADSEQ